MKYENFNFPEACGSLQACNGIALPYCLRKHICKWKNQADVSKNQADVSCHRNELLALAHGYFNVKKLYHHFFVLIAI